MTANRTFYKCLLFWFEKRKKYSDLSTVLKKLWQQPAVLLGMMTFFSVDPLKRSCGLLVVNRSQVSPEMFDRCQNSYFSTHGYSKVSVRRSCVVLTACWRSFVHQRVNLRTNLRFPWLGCAYVCTCSARFIFPSTLPILFPTVPQPAAVHSTARTSPDAKCNILGLIFKEFAKMSMTLFSLCHTGVLSVYWWENGSA